MTVANSSNVSSVVSTGLVITRENVSGLAEFLAKELFWIVRQDAYRYLINESAKKDLGII